MNFSDTETAKNPKNDFGPSALHEAQVLMNSEHVLTPRMVSSLLNVNVLLKNERIHTDEVEVEQSPVLTAVLIVASAVTIAIVSGTALLYVNEIGPFNKPSAAAELSNT